MLLNVTAQPRPGLTFQGGVNTGKQVNDYCDIRSQLPELTLPSAPPAGGIVSPTNPYCHVDPGFITKVTGIGSYVIPKIDVLFAGTIRSDQGAPQRATWNAPLATVSAALGRPANQAGTTVPIDLIAPGQVWGDRVNELDFRIAKIFRFGRTRTNVGFDVYNVLNQAAILTYNQTFVPNGTWLTPTSVLTPRFFKISAQIDF